MKLYRTNRAFKVLSVYIALSIIFPQSVTYNVFALTGGPSQPEFNSFTPISTSDMVNLSTGDFNYNIPIMDVGGYPLNLAYNAGITMDQEASWVGLGWNISAGQINRTVRGLPDDFDGDKLTYENNFKLNQTVGAHFGASLSVFGAKEGAAKGQIGLGVQYNNYNGISFKPSYGVSFQLSDVITVGMNVSGSVAEGATISPSIGIIKEGKSNTKSITANIGSSINSRQGLYSLSLSSSVKEKTEKKGKSLTGFSMEDGGVISGAGASFSFNNDLLFTPIKRVATKSKNLTFSAAVGSTAFGISGQVNVTGYGSEQYISNEDKIKDVKSFGYENTEKNEVSNDGVLDFNREKDREFTENTTLLPITNYTYDMYSINGQGVSGAFRPYRSQIGFVNDTKVVDIGTGKSFGVEVEGGWIFAVGVDIEISDSHSSTGLWNRTNRNYAIDNFKNIASNDNVSLDYEKVYFRNVGEINVDKENNTQGFYNKKLAGSSPINLAISSSGGKYNRALNNSFNEKIYNANGTSLQRKHSPLSGKLKRDKRLLRNQSIQKVKVKDILDNQQGYTKSVSPFYEINTNAKPNHTLGFNIIKSDGSRYIYGKSAYNKIKKEATFAVSKSSQIDNLGLVDYQNNDNSIYNDKGVDHFFNRTTTPAYAHSYLLTSVLSSDYEDLTGNGATIDDLGSYTRFEYTSPHSFKWRVPFKKGKATANRGYYSHKNDQKANYIYGEREQVYLKSIETKTHVAIFNLSYRDDGASVLGENGGINTAVKTKKIDSIQLFSKLDYDLNGLNATPIKTAHFEYDYTLCKKIPNSVNNQGKLTLKKVYFTYQRSKMGMYMPYVFSYGEYDSNQDGVIDDNDEPFNPDYNLKGYDIWGNFKENKNSFSLLGTPTNSEFPYTEQGDKFNADKNTVAWTLTSIDLPSGGGLEIQYEADNYQYVQNKRVMQLFEVSGTGSSENPSINEVNNTTLYSQFDNEYLYVKVNTEVEFEEEDYINWLINEPIYFKFLVNMTKNQDQYDFVSGYFNVDPTKFKDQDKKVITISNSKYLILPMKFLSLDGKKNQREVNPISKAGWYFGRQNLNNIVYSIGGNYENKDFVSIVEDLVGSIGTVFQIAEGPNETLRNKGVANKFNNKKSWIRLLIPKKEKFGGGSRVKKLQMTDNWDEMTNEQNTTSLYKKFYGQEYSYTEEEGDKTIGVASFEPNGSKENPFVLPFYNKQKDTDRDKLLAPKEMNFVEKPIGESFFPSPSVTYGRVTVKNLAHDRIIKNATGTVVNTYYTTYDFPTITDHTELNSENVYYDKANTVSQFLNFSVKNHITASQGFVIEKNDMNGKQKAQWVYAEGAEQPISGVEYKYNLNEDNQLKNDLPVVTENGIVKINNIGINYDVINDFRQSYSSEVTKGVDTNVAGFIAFIFPIVVPVPLPTYAKHENVLRTATTTKVIEKHGILKEKIAYDLGAEISTENIAWDANTGEVLVTKTVNSFDDAYYTINYPAYWKNKGMGSSTINLGVEGLLTATDDRGFQLANSNNQKASDFFLRGDQIYTYNIDGTFNSELWVLDIVNNNLILMDRMGVIVNDCLDDEDKVKFLKFKIMRSGYRNLQKASMASITTQKNPIPDITATQEGVLPTFQDVNTNPSKYKIINASAVEYSDFWKPQQEQGLKFFDYNEEDVHTNMGTLTISNSALTKIFDDYNINPYLYNIKGEWRAKKSWAYLTGRYRSNKVKIKKDGFFTSFVPFYILDNNREWIINPDAVVSNENNSNKKWTFASAVTEYSPYGYELESKDALNRYSSAQYGYRNTLPVAVASNTKYTEIGYDGFEDYKILSNGKDHFKFNIPSDNIKSSIAHTGKKSIVVEPGNSAKLFRKLGTPTQSPIIEDCVTDGGGDNDVGCYNNTLFIGAFYDSQLSYKDVFDGIIPSINSDDINIISMVPFNLQTDNPSCTVIFVNSRKYFRTNAFQSELCLASGDTNFGFFHRKYLVTAEVSGKKCVYSVIFQFKEQK